ncbi:MAG TPA: hypothetical protein DCO79_03040 [Spirochaeta sp.]|nr:hypothetical protein [Spirochaeta sp.]
MKKYLPLLIVIFIFFSVNPIYSQNDAEAELIEQIESSYQSDEPTWLLMERGKQAYDIGEYGLASRVFREVLNREKVYPDAEVWLAYIFEEEGEYLLAEKQYIRALENSSELYIIEDEITILYKLAEIYRKTDQWGLYENTLLSILDKDESGGVLKLQYSMLDALKDYGVDKMFELYRYENTKFGRARIELGIFYYQTGRYTESQINLILPIISEATTGFNYIFNRTADYDYYNFDLHIDNMLRYNTLSEFLTANVFFKAVYYLAASLYADGYSDTADSLWRIVYKYDESGSTWKIRSARQLRSPFIEPIISHRT